MKMEFDEDVEDLLNELGIVIPDEESDEESDESELAIEESVCEELGSVSGESGESDESEESDDESEESDDESEESERKSTIDTVRSIEASKGVMQVTLVRDPPSRLEDEVEVVRKFESRGFSVKINGVEVTEVSPCVLRQLDNRK